MSYEEQSSAAAELAAAEALTRTCNSGMCCPIGFAVKCPFGRTPCEEVDVDDWLSRIQIEMRHESSCSC